MQSRHRQSRGECLTPIGSVGDSNLPNSPIPNFPNLPCGSSPFSWSPFSFASTTWATRPWARIYDEAANAILTDENSHMARARSLSAPTRAREVGYFYWLPSFVRLVGQPLIAIRLNAAFIGVLSVALTYRLARASCFAHCPPSADRGRSVCPREPDGEAGHFPPRGNGGGLGWGQWIALLAAAIQAVNLLGGYRQQ